MKNLITYPMQAVHVVIKDKNYSVVFFSLSLVLFWLFIYIPVRTIPGNDFAFQLSILRPTDIILLVLLSLLTALSLTLHLYILRNRISTKRVAVTVGNGIFGSLVGITGSLFATASCAACVMTLLGFLGVGTVFFLLDHRQLIIVFSILLMLVSLHFTARKVLDLCDICKVHRSS
jgi:hypothetical protein